MRGIRSFSSAAWAAAPAHTEQQTMMVLSVPHYFSATPAKGSTFTLKVWLLPLESHCWRWNPPVSLFPCSLWYLPAFLASLHLTTWFATLITNESSFVVGAPHVSVQQTSNWLNSTVATLDGFLQLNSEALVYINMKRLHVYIAL